MPLDPRVRGAEEKQISLMAGLMAEAETKWERQYDTAWLERA